MDSIRQNRFAFAFKALMLTLAAGFSAATIPLDCASGTAPQQATAEETYALAAAFYADQNWESAIEQFRKLLKDNPDSDQVTNARFFLGESLIQSKQHQQALEVFKECLLKGDGQDGDGINQADSTYATRAKFRIAECHYLNSEFETAKTLFNDYMNSSGSDPLAEFALPYLGELYLRDGQNHQSRESYENALKRFPTSALSNKCRLGLAQALNRLGQPTQAERFYRFVAEQVTHPLADDAQLLIGKMYAERNQWDRAKPEFEQLVRNFPDSEALPEAKYLMAKRDLASGDWQSSWKRIEPLLSQPMSDTLFTRVALDAAVVAVRVEKIERAQELILQVKQKNPDESAFEFLSVIEIDIANRQKDIRSLRKLVTDFEQRFDSSPHITRCIEPLARLHYDRSEFAEAAVRYQQLIEIVSVNPNLQGNLPAWRYLVGLSRIGTTEYQLALGYLQSIREFGNNKTFQAATSFAIATAMAGENRWAESIPEYKKYMELLPDGDDAVRCQADLAVAQVKCDKLSQAIETLDRVATRHPQDMSVLGACEVVAEAALQKKDAATSQKYFQIMAQAEHAEFASRGANGLVWTGDKSMMTTENLRNVIDSGVDTDLALEAVIGQVQKLQASNEHQQTIDILSDIITSHPKSPLINEASFRMAVSLQRVGGIKNSKRAATLLQEFTKENSDHKLADLARYELAWAKHDSGDISGAEKQFSEIADKFPNSEYVVDATYRAAMLSKELSDTESANRRLNQLIVAHPKHDLAGYAHYSLGEFQCQQQLWSMAIPSFNKVIASNANDTLKNPARYWLAESLYQDGQIAAAEKQFQEIKETEFDKPEIGSLIWLRLAECAAKRTDWAAVEQIVQVCRTRTSESAQTWQLDYLQGRVFMSRAKFNEARQMFDSVLGNDAARRTKTAAMSQWMIGESWFHQEDYRQSLRSYLLVDSLYDYPKWRSLALLQAAKCHLHLGDPKTARKTCERMLNTFPDSSHSADARQLLVDIAAANPKSSNTRPANFSK